MCSSAVVLLFLCWEAWMKIIFPVKTLSSCSRVGKKLRRARKEHETSLSFPSPRVNYRLFLYLSPIYGRISVTHVVCEQRSCRRVIARRTMVRWTRNEIKKEEKRRRKGKTLFKALYSLSLLLQRKWTIKLFEATMTMGWDEEGRGEGKERERISIPLFRRHENKFDSVE